VLYTDGLVEARKDILEGTEALMRHAHSLALVPAEMLVTGLVRRALAEGDRRDDSLALVLRRSPSVQRASWDVKPDPVEIRVVRREFATWLGHRGLAGEALEDLELVAAELMSNAARAARTSLSLRSTVEPGAVMLEVEDDGEGRADLDTLGGPSPSIDADDGRGLFIVRALSDDVRILSTYEGTVVRCVRALDPAVRPQGHRLDGASMEV